jgi:hypothetical protein
VSGEGWPRICAADRTNSRVFGDDFVQLRIIIVAARVVLRDDLQKSGI